MLISIQNFYSNVFPRAHQGLCGSLCSPGNDGWALQNITESVGKGSYVVIREESVDSILNDFRRIAAPCHDGRRIKRSSLPYHQRGIIIDGWEEEEMTMASKEAKQEGGRFWLQLMGYTSLTWLSRFAIVVAILVAFHCQGNMLVAWCRQWVMWMISILSPTPGGSGVAELMFRLYYADFLPDASVAILAAMLWRAIFYYPFLVMGTLVLPKWIAKK
jgi:uncharacterized membrane protein YbhN (UPF0104 family)